MKTVLTTLALAFTLLTATAQTTPSVTTNGTTITVTVPVQSNDGSVFFALHTEETFLKKGITSMEAPIVDGFATVTFDHVPEGEYGITLFHDKNSNKKMDFEANGMPKEMYGVSNNVMSFGPPQWKDAKFEVANEPITMEIRM